MFKYLIKAKRRREICNFQQLSTRDLIDFKVQRNFEDPGAENNLLELLTAFKVINDFLKQHFEIDMKEEEEATGFDLVFWERIPEILSEKDELDFICNVDSEKGRYIGINNINIVDKKNIEKVWKLDRDEYVEIKR